MTDFVAQSGDDDVAYSYRPSLFGAGCSFRLTPGGLAWDAGRRSGLVPYQAFKHIAEDGIKMGRQLPGGIRADRRVRKEADKRNAATAIMYLNICRN